jgi:hypothetical protein
MCHGFGMVFFLKSLPRCTNFCYLTSVRFSSFHLIHELARYKVRWLHPGPCHRDINCSHLAQKYSLVEVGVCHFYFYFLFSFGTGPPRPWLLLSVPYKNHFVNGKGSYVLLVWWLSLWLALKAPSLYCCNFVLPSTARTFCRPRVLSRISDTMYLTKVTITQWNWLMLLYYFGPAFVYESC